MKLSSLGGQSIVSHPAELDLLPVLLVSTAETMGAKTDRKIHQTIEYHTIAYQTMVYQTMDKSSEILRLL